ncbi:MAG: hypothetical protein PVJ57_17685 [Phycisphaerae bacterium]|jgi:hypothetical protein
MITSFPTIVRDLEQLELAAELLDRKTPTAARLALILIDNVMEGIAVRIIKHKFAVDAYVGRAVGFKYPPRTRKRITSDFDSKVSFLAVTDAGVVDREAAEAAKRIHSFRNESYHHVRYHEDVIEHVARKYFEYACRVCSRSHGNVMVDMSCNEPLFARHGFTDASQYPDGANSILACLAKGRSCEHNDLAQALAGNLSRRIGETIGQVDSLAKEPYGLPVEDTLRHIQFYANDRTERQVEADDRTTEWFQRRTREWEDELAAYQPHVKYTTLGKWCQSARALKNERQTSVLLAKYRNIDDQFTPIEDVVSDAVAAHEAYVDNEVNRMRGN